MCLGKFCSNLNNARVPLRVILSPRVFPIDLLAPRVRARHCTCASLSQRSSGPHYRSHRTGRRATSAHCGPSNPSVQSASYDLV